jgi:hypothetical protein
LTDVIVFSNFMHPAAIVAKMLYGDYLDVSDLCRVCAVCELVMQKFCSFELEKNSSNPRKMVFCGHW